MDLQDVQQFCQNLPKVELHAHLNTSYSFACLDELMSLHGGQNEYNKEDMCIASNKDIDESFLLFTKIQKLVTTEEAVYLLTRRVISEFAQDNVKYLELRSTPKQIESTGMTRELYMRTMIRAVQDCNKDGLDITVRLLPSIDRRLGVPVAEITVELAYKLMTEFDGIVVGVDFSGDPQVGNAEDYIPVFLDALKKGLKLSLHLAEIPLYEETKNVLQSCADYSKDLRIGHGTFIHRYDKGLGHEEIEDFVTKHKIPIEVCMTSNKKSKTVESLDQSHFKYWMDKGHPAVLCTDGKGAYVTSLTEEYIQAAKTFHLSKKDLIEITLGSVDYIFESQEFKSKLKDKFNHIIASLDN